MTDLQEFWPPDLPARRQALDPRQSFIVQAPAGSGKTELLIQRILTLLGICDQPEEVLAITFTRKAAGEMKARLLDALDKATAAPQPESEHERLTWQRAQAVLDRDRLNNWGLLDNPSRLQVMTIDSLCSRLVKRMPWLSRFGSTPQISDDPAQLYRRAVESLLQRLDADKGRGGDALETLLAHLENRLPRIRDLLMDMLGRRDQWLRHVLVDDRAAQRQHLEQSLRDYIQERLDRFRQGLGTTLFAELCQLFEFAAVQLSLQGDDSLSRQLEKSNVDGDAAGYCLAMSTLVRKADGGIRMKVDKRQGFPTDKDPRCIEMKQRMLDFLDQVRTDPAAVDAFKALDSLPDPHYAEPQWQILDALLVLLPLAVVELSSVFTESGQVDFVELAGAARRALGDTDGPEDLLLQFDSRVQHILVDEFQDTSHAQYHLLNQLTSGWAPGDGRTLFVVGDPMQSIYRFREAEVGLYLHARTKGLPEIRLTPLTLTANFRSQQQIIDWVNRICPPLFPDREDAARGAVTYSPAIATLPPLPGRSVQITCFSGRQDAQEGAAVVETVKTLRRDENIATVAILVRSRAHLLDSVASLKAAGIRFQAQEIDPLLSRPVTRDLLSLTRALLHLGDRVAWLSILRAPWCGLQADDLLFLCEDEGKRTVWQQLTDDQRQPGLFGLSADGEKRLRRFLPVITRSLHRRGTVSLRRLVESCWLSLGGPACVSASELEDAQQVFTLLEQLDEGGNLNDFSLFESRLAKLYASPDPHADESLQVMTIHKAKGLEFDAVILPGLGRQIRGEDKTLLRWLDHPQHGLLLAPIPASDLGDGGLTYRAIGAINQDRNALETLRMFYVAVTRARQRLYLFGHVLDNGEDELQPPAGTLLKSIWPALDQTAIDLPQPPQSAAAETTPQLPELKRLPHGWTVPEFELFRAPHAGTIQHASDQGEAGLSGAMFSLPSGHGRSVGTVVHNWLQIVAEEGLDAWPVDRLELIREQFENQLNGLGVARKSLEELVGKVLVCLRNSLTSERGRWLLSDHVQQASELALNGIVDGQVVHAAVDRTFIDSGIRWVVDYKTGSCPQTLSQDEFIAREIEKYRGQLSTYATLLKALDETSDVRCGLYFPMHDLWTEVPV